MFVPWVAVWFVLLLLRFSFPGIWFVCFMCNYWLELRSFIGHFVFFFVDSLGEVDHLHLSERYILIATVIRPSIRGIVLTGLAHFYTDYTILAPQSFQDIYT